jgi:hypothetical protein
MAETFHIKRNDRRPVLTVICRDGNGGAIDLSTATAVTFNMKKHSDGTVKIAGGAGTIDSPTTGQVSYAWAASDTNTSGIYLGEFEVTYGANGDETYPNDEPGIIINIQDDIA